MHVWLGNLEKLFFFTGGSTELGEKERKCDPIVNAIEIKVQNKDINFLMTIVILLLTPAQLFSSRVKLSFFFLHPNAHFLRRHIIMEHLHDLMQQLLLLLCHFRLLKKMTDSNISWWHHDSQPFLIHKFWIMSISSFLYDHGDDGRALSTSRGESYSLIKYILPVMRSFCNICDKKFLLNLWFFIMFIILVWMAFWYANINLKRNHKFLLF